MTNWKTIDYEIVASFIHIHLNFDPLIHGDEIIRLPVPYKQYDLSGFYDDNFSEELYDNLHSCATNWFKSIAKERMYAFSWQHEGFSFNPRLQNEVDEFGEWLVPVFPNGDYNFFFSEDFKNGVFADGINLSISLFGHKMIESGNSNMPIMFLSSLSDEKLH